VVGGVAAGVAGVVALGAWGAYALLGGGGAQPAEAVPDDALFYASLDLDPSASQKIEAIQILKKFPALEDRLDLSAQDDLREYVFTKAFDEAGCAELEYSDDVEPWIGDRVALAALPGENGGDPTPLVVLQVQDSEGASAGIEPIAECFELGDEFGHATFGGYLLLSDSQGHAESAAADAEAGSLAEDDAFVRWTEEAGDPGIVTAYAAPGAPDAFFDQKARWGDSAAVPGEARELYADFEGGALVLRFRDGAVEAEWAGKGLPAGASAPGGATAASAAGDLPGSTAAAVSVSLADGWLEKYLDSMSGLLSEGPGVGGEDALDALEARTGLSVPEDVETLLGDNVSIALDSDFDPAALESSEDPTLLPAGVRVVGDADAIMAVVDKLRQRLGPQADALVVERGDGVVAFGLNQAYVERLVEPGSLGNEAAFEDVVPEPDKASSLVYVDFDAGEGWLESVADVLSDGDPEARENVAPLDALGMSAWRDGDEVDHGRLRLTTN
jgi:hypothetical protein